MKNPVLRETLCGDIVRAMGEVTKIWERLDYFQANGALPKESAISTDARRVSELNVQELIQLCWNIYPVIAKLKKQIEKETNEIQKKVLEAALAARLNEVEQLKSIRDNGIR